MRRVIDVSLDIRPDMLVFPGDPPVEVVSWLSLSRGDPANVSELRLGTHTGTHIDPPVHFIEGGAGIDGIQPDRLVGEAWVAHLPRASGPIEPDDLETLGLPPTVERLLLKTSNSKIWSSRPPVEFPQTYACLSPDAATWAVERGIRLIGIDFLSIERHGSQGFPVHHTLLSSGVVIVEGLDLREAPPGACTFVCLPIKIRGGDGGPARALVIPDG